MENILALVFSVLINYILAGETCYFRKTYYLSYSKGIKYCYSSCCGSYYNRYCCYKTSGGTIAGAVVGALVCLAVIAGVVICIVMKKKRSAGAIITPFQNNTTGVTIVHSNTQNQCSSNVPPIQAYPPPIQGYNQPPPPPMYQQHYGHPQYPPPQYPMTIGGGINPAYPPSTRNPM
ncbi:cysteine and tyrosine-rich protein 1-like [Ostrea edulis]|uniref:cysteine and tyrosine-rich protein 1-like n=1 Tax=Ostrea edulis TaxID=37623 RepID=UPI0024AFEBE5|nr:cysteine and tyrosine-rich protein 1-like [Ostrea edulis]